MPGLLESRLRPLQLAGGARPLNHARLLISTNEEARETNLNAAGSTPPAQRTGLKRGKDESGEFSLVSARGAGV